MCWKESKLWWKSNFRFPEVNTLTFEIQQATRKNGSQYQDKELKGIIDIGVSLEISK